MNIAALERDLATQRTAIEQLLGTQMRTAEQENRARTDEERAAVETLLTTARELKAKIERAKGDDTLLAEIARLGSGPIGTPARPVSMKSFGQQWVESDAYDFFRQKHHRTSSAWRSPSVELITPAMYATTLTEDPASGGALVVPDYLPGIVPLLFPRVVVADLFAPGTTTSNLISYMREKTFTNAAAPVAEGAAKPESALVFEAATDPVRKIAHWLPVTEEMLEDVAQIQSYIDARLRTGLSQKEEQQLLYGTGVAPEILGVTKRTGITPPLARGADSNMDALFKQMSTIASTVFVQCTGIVLNPANWQTIQLTKNAMGVYMGTGPFAPAQAPTLWGVPVAITPAETVNIGLVGDFRGSGQIFRNGGVRVEASNSHQDYFVKNLVAIRAEERLALAIYRPAAFGEVTGLN